MKVNTTFVASIFSLLLCSQAQLQVKASTYETKPISTHVTGACDSEVFEGFLDKYNKLGKYGDADTNEYKRRCGLVTIQKQWVDEYNTNEQLSRGITFGLNEHSDLTRSERAARNGAKPDLDPVSSKPTEEARRRRLSQHTDARRQLETLPDSIDYTTTANPFEMIAVTDVKNQGQCGDCYTFSASAIVEGQLALELGSSEMLSLSEQQVTDCVYDDRASLNEDGCKGGFPNQALDYIEAYGISTLTNYPQLKETKDAGLTGTCTAYSTYNGFEGSGVENYTPYATISQKGYADMCDETSVMQYLDTYGPLGIIIDASSTAFNSYTSGILTNADLSLSTALTSNDCASICDHAVTLVGYGTDDGTDYWLVKNSWGTTWGEDGYVRFERGVGNCSTACVSYQASWAFSSSADANGLDTSELSGEMDDDFYDVSTSSEWSTEPSSSDPSSSSSSSSSSSEKLNAWQTTLLVLGCVVVAVGSVFGAQEIQKRRRNNKHQHTDALLRNNDLL